MRVYPARHPNNLAAKHPILIEEMVALVRKSKTSSVKAIINMVKDLKRTDGNAAT